MIKALPTGILFLLCLLCASVVRGQEQSRIVFFRADAASGETYSALSEWRVYQDALLLDGSTIASMRSGSVFVYTAAQVGGSYSFVPTVSGAFYSGEIAVPELRGGIAFIQISLGSATPVAASMRAVDAAAFEQFYTHSKVFRRHVSDAGFASLEALGAGFNPISAAQIQPAPGKAMRPRIVNDTVFLDERGARTIAARAAAFSVATADTGGLFLVREYYARKRTLKSETHWTTLDSTSREGAYRGYYANGRLNNAGTYRANYQDGLWSYYRDTPNNQLWYTTEFSAGRREGMLRSYHPNGALKREELHRTIRGAGGSATLRGNYRSGESDSLVSGRCYDSSGREIPFTAFEVLPVPSFDMNDFLSRIIVYPREARRRGITGRVVVQFVISAAGKVQDAKVIRHADVQLDAEALRVINAMPAWQPGLQDDRPVDIVFTLPITFALD